MELTTKEDQVFSDNFVKWVLRGAIGLVVLLITLITLATTKTHYYNKPSNHFKIEKYNGHYQAYRQTHWFGEWVQIGIDCDTKEQAKKMVDKYIDTLSSPVVIDDWFEARLEVGKPVTIEFGK